jgi:hypothetical protein
MWDTMEEDALKFKAELNTKDLRCANLLWPPPAARGLPVNTENIVKSRYE